MPHYHYLIVGGGMIADAAIRGIRVGLVYYLREGRVRGVLLWNLWEQVDAARTLIRGPSPFRAGDLMGRLAT